MLGMVYAELDVGNAAGFKGQEWIVFLLLHSGADRITEHIETVLGNKREQIFFTAEMTARGGIGIQTSDWPCRRLRHIRVQLKARL